MMEDTTMDMKYMSAFDAFNNYDSGAMILDPYVINPSAPMLSDWSDPNDLDFNTFINPVAS
jgi:hypothetical protein